MIYAHHELASAAPSFAPFVLFTALAALMGLYRLFSRIKGDRP